MKQRLGVLSAVLVAMMMIVTTVPLQDSDSSASNPADEWYDNIPEEDKEVRYVSYGDDTYSMSIPFLDDRFGLAPNHPEPGDPAYGVLGKVIPEIHSYMGDNSRNKMVKADGTYVSDGRTVTYGVERGVEFSLGFSDNYERTGVEDVFTYGILTSGTWFIQSTTNTDAHFKYASDSQYLGRLLTEYKNVSMVQGSNLLPYATGNFVDDSTEEFALYVGDKVEIYDCIDGFMWPVQTISLPDGSYNGYGYGVNPVSMASGDTDGDGLDEIVLTVEYSDNHSNAYDCCNGQHRTYIYIINHGSAELRYSQIYTSINNERLDSVMTSVCTMDYDSDGIDEIIVGGYLWDNYNHPIYVCYDPAYYCGELYLGAVDPDEIGFGNVAPSHLKRLMDDPGQFDTFATNGNKTDGREHKNHGNTDTSIMTEDWSDNYYGYCRSPNWTNWTIPMATVMFKSQVEEPFVYFDNCIYRIDRDGAAFHKFSVPLDAYQDNNNCQCVNIGVGALIERPGMECIPFEDLYRFVAMDRQSRDGADLYWTHEIAYYEESNDSCRMKTVPSMTYVYSGGFIEPCMGCLTEWDTSDKIDVQYKGTVSSFVDPMVIAAISAIPCESDLDDCLIAGANSIGYTEYAQSTGTTSENGFTFALQYDVGGMLDTPFTKLSIKGGLAFDYTETSTQTVTITNAFSSSDDSVVVYLQPYDCFNYVVTKNVDGVMKDIGEQVYRWHSPMQIILIYEDYYALMSQYNDSMKMFADHEGIDFTPLDILPRFDHVVGDVSSYDEGFSNALHTMPVEYAGGGKSEINTRTIDLCNTTTVSNCIGGNGNISVMAGFGAFAGVELDLSGGNITSHTDMTGMAFTSSLATGFSRHYNWEPEDSVDVTSQYSMIGTMWAEQKNVNNSPYIYLGYTVDTHTNACKNGWVVPDTYIPDGSDDTDPRNPTSDSLYLKAMVPGDVYNHLLGEKYVLQMRFQGAWYDWDKAPSLRLEYELEDPDGNISEMRDLEPIKGQDTIYWIKVSNLGHLGMDSFDFRLVGYNDEGNAHPSKATEAYLYFGDMPTNITFVDNFKVGADKLLILDQIALEDGTFLLIKTDLEPGRLMDVHMQHPEGTYLPHAQCMVGANGEVLLRIGDAPQDEPMSPWLAGALLAMILAFVGVGAYVLRKS